MDMSATHRISASHPSWMVCSGPTASIVLANSREMSYRLFSFSSVALLLLRVYPLLASWDIQHALGTDHWAQMSQRDRQINRAYVIGD